jgi:sulfatase modifying factor 1
MREWASGLSVFSAVLVLASCGGSHRELASGPPPPEATVAPPDPQDVPRVLSSAEPNATFGAPSACPADMAFVDTSYCPNPALRCLKSEYDKPNHITICHQFEAGQTCIGKERRERFCIDRYEYPNQAGAHPPVMVSWYDAASLCAEKKKRLCFESEWVTACEGPDKLPFPYGLDRDKTKCNIDNAYIKPDLGRVYASDPKIQGPELVKLDQSVKSGAREGCVSGFGVHDLTGNVDEWVNAETSHDKSKWAGLKGGAWGHVRNACRPMTVSHPPEFTYYFISFRCCADAAHDDAAFEDPKFWRHPPQHDPTPPNGTVSRGLTPSR